MFNVVYVYVHLFVHVYMYFDFIYSYYMLHSHVIFMCSIQYMIYTVYIYVTLLLDLSHLVLFIVHRNDFIFQSHVLCMHNITGLRLYRDEKKTTCRYYSATLCSFDSELPKSAKPEIA